jgi:hypothetical protein
VLNELQQYNRSRHVQVGLTIVFVLAAGNEVKS